jgi:hypothetical protein
MQWFLFHGSQGVWPSGTAIWVCPYTPHHAGAAASLAAAAAHGAIQVMRLSADAVRAARTAEEQPSVLLREDSIQLLPGPLSQLTDDW